MKKLTFITMLFLTVVLTGCNTVQGFGEDLQKLGTKIDQKAKEKQ